MDTRDGEIRQLVDRFATALDEDDFDAARRFLDPGCIYHLGDKTLRGPDAIIASYRAGSELARRLFSRVVFGHELEAAVDSTTIRVHYFDELSAGSEVFTYTSEQDVTVGPAGTVLRIADRHDPAERQRLDSFMERHGISRPAR